MKKWLIGLSVLLNALVLVAVAALWIGGQGFVIDTFIKPGHERYVSQFEVLPVEPGDIVFLGDSITEGGLWDELFPGVPVRDRGIGGDVTEGILARLDQVVAGRPAKVFLLIGTNDLANAGLAPDAIAANIETIVDTIRSRSPDTAIYVQSVLPRAASFREDVEALNDNLQQRVAGKAVWLDLYPLFLDTTDGSIRDDLSNDELHLLGAGYLKWRDAIESYVKDPV